MKDLKVIFALTGSFCTFDKALECMERLTAAGAQVQAAMSKHAAETDTRFGKAKDFVEKIEAITKKSIIKTIEQAEPVGPKKLADVMLIAPCTGNTLAKIAAGISDTSVTLAAKSHLRGGRPLVIALSTNDALGANGTNFTKLLNTKNIFFVPLLQDDYLKKPNSLTADLAHVEDTIAMALAGKQYQPLFL